MKYQLGSLTIEAIDTYVRVSVLNIGGMDDTPDRIRVTKKQCPTSVEVANLVAEIRGYWPDNAVLQACGRAATDAKNNKMIIDLT